MARITTIYQTVEARAMLLDTHPIAAVEALAYQIHNFYNAVDTFVAHLHALLEN